MRILFLGDSYTIGEQVKEDESFPYRLVSILNVRGYKFLRPKVVAKTGWTTDELQFAIDEEKITTQFDFVTLLIGVNNQYRGRKVEDYIPEFEALLKLALHFAGGKQKRVIVISIPDWGVTPFASLPRENGELNDKAKIAKEIDAYNDANKAVAKKYGVNYLYITKGTREAETQPELLAADGLHPSGKEYLRWAQQLAEIIEVIINDQE